MTLLQIPARPGGGWRRLRWPVIVTAGFAAVVAAYIGWRATRPNVLLILVDTLRADRLGAYGNTRGLTPFLDELAAKGTIFRYAFATSSWTCPSMASLFTSRFPSQHHVTSFEAALGEDEVTLGETLRAAGYAPGGYLANWRLLSSLGYSQGFRRWWLHPIPGRKVRGPELRAESLSWLRLPWPQPRFLYVHYMEPHGPYLPPEPHRSRWACPEIASVDVAAANQAAIEMRWQTLSPLEVACLASLYDGEVAAFDAELRTLFAELQQNGFLDDAIVIVTADHGEEFLEHGRMLHGFTLYDEMVHVPLLVLAPGYAPGQVIHEKVSLVDVAPTLVELLGLAPVPQFEGRSLVGLMRRAGEPPVAPDAAIASLDPVRADGRPVLLELASTGGSKEMRAHTRGIVLDAVKLLEGPDGAQTIFNLATDPREQRPNVMPFWRHWKLRLNEVIAGLQADLRRRAGRETKGEVLDEATREKLRALGYHF